MKLLSYILALAATTVAAVELNPYEQRFGWRPSPTTNVNCYVFYLGTNTVAYASNILKSVAITNMSWLGATNELMAGLAKTNFVAGVTNYVIATARDVEGVESEPSNEVRFVPPPPPRMLRLTTQESASVNGPWRDLPLPPVDIPMTETSRFFRVAGVELRTPE